MPPQKCVGGAAGFLSGTLCSDTAKLNDAAGHDDPRGTSTPLTIGWEWVTWRVSRASVKIDRIRENILAHRSTKQAAY